MHAFDQYLCQRSCEMLNCELTLVLSCRVFHWVTISISPFIRSTTTLAFRCFVHSNPVKVSNYISYLPSHFFAAFFGFLVIIQEEKRVQIYLISIQRQGRLKLQIWTTLDDLSCQSMRSRNHSMNGQKTTTSPDTHSSPEVFSQKNISSVGDLCPLNSNQSKEMTRDVGQEKAQISRVFRERSRSVPVPLLIHSFCIYGTVNRTSSPSYI